MVTKCGAHHVFNHNHKNYEKKMVEHIGGEGFDVIIEHLANINLGHDVQMLKEGKCQLSTKVVYMLGMVVVYQDWVDIEIAIRYLLLKVLQNGLYPC